MVGNHPVTIIELLVAVGNQTARDCRENSDKRLGHSLLSLSPIN